MCIRDRVILVAVSLFTEAPEKDVLDQTVWRPDEAVTDGNWSFTTVLFSIGALIAAMGAILILFW